MKFWQVVSWNDTDHMVAIARCAQDLGFEGLILADHPIMPGNIESAYPYSEDGKPPMTDEMEFPDPLITFAAMASVTSSLRMMTGVYLLGLRHPVVAAKDIATLARLSGGRFSLGIGSGWLKEEHDLLGVDFHTRGRRLNESIEVMRHLWRGEPVDYQGEFFNFEQLRIRPYPAQPVPIIGGGTSALALQRAARLCDGWYGPGNTVAELRPLLANLKAYREASALPWQDYEITAPMTEPLTPALCDELTGMGVHGVVNYPFLFGCSSNASLAQKQDYMAQFATRFGL